MPIVHRKSDNCIKIQLVPQRHDSSLVSVMFSLLSSFLPHLQGTVMKHFTGPLVDLATLMVVVLLFLAEALEAHPPGRRRQPWRKRERT